MHDQIESSFFFPFAEVEARMDGMPFQLPDPPERSARQRSDKMARERRKRSQGNRSACVGVGWSRPPPPSYDIVSGKEPLECVLTWMAVAKGHCIRLHRSLSSTYGNKKPVDRWTSQMIGKEGERSHKLHQ